MGLKGWMLVNRATRALLTGAGAAVAGMAVVGTAAYASTKYFVRVAIDRQQPKVRKMEKAREKLRGAAPGSNVILGVHPSCVSQMTGQKRCNIDALCLEFDLKSLKIIGCDTEKGEILVDYIANERIL